MARLGPTIRMTDVTMAWANPEVSMSLPKIAPSRKTGK